MNIYFLECYSFFLVFSFSSIIFMCYLQYFVCSTAPHARTHARSHARTHAHAHVHSPPSAALPSAVRHSQLRIRRPAAAGPGRADHRPSRRAASAAGPSPRSRACQEGGGRGKGGRGKGTEGGGGDSGW